MTSVLIVDDEDEIRRMVVQRLSALDFKCIEARDGEDGLRQLAAHDDCHIVLTDISMPRMDGLEMIEQARSGIPRQIEFIVFTGSGDKEKAVRALRFGVCEFLDKPMSWNSVLSALRGAQQSIAQHMEREEAVARAYAIERKLTFMERKLQGSDRRVARQIASVVGFRDIETSEHCERVGRYCRSIAEWLNMPEERAEDIGLAAILHDVGKVGMPDDVLTKAGPLSSDEFLVMQDHTLYGARMLADYRDNPVLDFSYQIALGHHERWDGSGYPYGLMGVEIPTAARICAIADVYDALRTQRRYKEGMSHEQAVGVILEGDGRTEPEHFDPTILEVFADHSQDIRKIYDDLPDEGFKPALCA